jgi:hypothetical protein
MHGLVSRLIAAKYLAGRQADQVLQRLAAMLAVACARAAKAIAFRAVLQIPAGVPVPGIQAIA